MQRKRNEGGRFSSKHGSDWYRQIEAEHIARIEAEQAREAEAAYLAPLVAQVERAQLAQAIEDYYEAYDDGDLVPWDRAA